MAKPNLHFASLSTTAKSTLKQLKLSEAATFLRGLSLSKDDVREVADVSNGVPCVLYGHLYTTYGEIAYSSKYVTDAEIDEKVTSKAGDVLMPTSDVTPRGLATATCVMFDNAIVGGDINILRPQPGIDGRYLSLAINSQKQKLYPLIVGSTVRHLHASDLKGLSYFFPSIEEQQKIAEFFTALDEKIHSIENKLSLLDRTKKYFVNALLQKKLRFVKDNGSTYTDWVSCNVANIADVIGGGTPSTTDEAYWNGDINWFTPAEINSKYLIPSKRKISKLGLDNSSAKLLPKNSLLLTTRASLGLCSINSLDSFVCTNQGFQSLICKENAFHEFVYYMVTSDAFKKELKTKASGSTFLEVSSASLKSIKIEIPCYEEQIKIANFISQMDLKIELLVKQKKVFEKMKKAFMQRMFV